MTFLLQQFKNRAYPPHLTSTPVIPFNQRPHYLSSSTKEKTHSCNFITTFDPSLSLKQTILEDWPRLSSHQELRQTFSNPPRITYKHAPNLSQILVRAKLHQDINTSDLPSSPSPSISITTFPAKNIPCRNQQCATCPQLTSRSHFSSHQTKQYFEIPSIFSCDTTHAIYLLDCSTCGKQYVGETHTTIRNRMKHHRNMANTALNRPIYAHLQLHQSEFSSYQLTIIDQIIDLQERKQKEQFYIKLLKTKIPFGLNVIHPKK